MTNCSVFFSRFGFVLLVAFVVHFNPEDLSTAAEEREREGKKNAKRELKSDLVDVPAGRWRCVANWLYVSFATARRE